MRDLVHWMFWTASFPLAALGLFFGLYFDYGLYLFPAMVLLGVIGARSSIVVRGTSILLLCCVCLLLASVVLGRNPMAPLGVEPTPPPARILILLFGSSSLVVVLSMFKLGVLIRLKAFTIFRGLFRVTPSLDDAHTT